MSTGVIILLIVIVAVVVGGALALAVRNRGPAGGHTLKRRFGPEYDRTLARHDGDAKAAERDLSERVKRHGSLRERPLEPAEREQYETRWAVIQERFVDSPREAVAEADRLLGEVAAARGFPDGGRYDEQLEALSVHHAHHVHGYRRVHRAVHTPTAADGRPGADTTGGTEELREALVEARGLFDALVAPERGIGTRRHDERSPRHRQAGRSHSGRGHLRWALTRR
ncbi:hypothetical protein [Streptomyces cavernae]|uniref:hypothetical protein n=1 Tax=Streptomyces cavernae TaxID=2259034 RepID=UPI000FEBD8C7|nr:hypothetical protein [Streptomyces cavernae]